MQVWSFEPFKPITTLEEYVAEVRGHATCRDNWWLLVVPFVEGPLEIWDSQGKKKLRALTGQRGSVRCAAFFPDGRIVASSGDD